MFAEKYGIDTTWIDLGGRPDNSLFNPMDFVFKDTDEDKILDRLIYVMSQPEYFYFTCKYVLNIELLPMQMVFLKQLWTKKYPMLIAARGASKSYTLAVYALLRALLLPGRKVIVVGAAFRQSKVIFKYMEDIWLNAPILRDICDNRSGPQKQTDSFDMLINNSIIKCLPLGDGEKIRGQRAHDILSDEMASIPRDIFERVVVGFTTVSANPVENVKMRAKRAIQKKTEKESKNLWIENQIVFSGTAYYDFNHFAEYWRKHRSWLRTKGDRKALKEILGEDPKDEFDLNDYTIIRVPVEKLPPGLMDDGIIARAKATVHSGIYEMEYQAIFSADSQGFFKRSLIESCCCKPEGHEDAIKINGEEIFFEAKLHGHPEKKYIYGVDPASEVDHFSIVIIEVNKDHRKIVYCWTTDRQQHKEKVKSGIADETDFYSYAARKIRDLMKVFPCKEIAMDSQGGGIAVMEALHDKDKVREGEVPIWPVIDPDKPSDTDDNPGLHILRMCNFAKYDWLRDANHGLRKDFEDKTLLFPFFDTVSLGIAAEMDGLSGNMFDTLEDCVMDIEELKKELTQIVVTQTATGRERWDTPESKVGTGRKERLRKDRYSALLIANMSARTPEIVNPLSGYSVVGGFAQSMDSDVEFNSKNAYNGPAWWRPDFLDIY